MFQVDAKHPTPLYHQLDRSIRFAIATGKLGIGDQLPTVRQLAVDLRINANTVAKVYAELERNGVVETRRGVGTFVTARQRAMRCSRYPPRPIRAKGSAGVSCRALTRRRGGPRSRQSGQSPAYRPGGPPAHAAPRAARSSSKCSGSSTSTLLRHQLNLRKMAINTK